MDPCIHIPRGPSWPVLGIPLPLPMQHSTVHYQLKHVAQHDTKSLPGHRRPKLPLTLQEMDSDEISVFAMILHVSIQLTGALTQVHKL